MGYLVEGGREALVERVVLDGRDGARVDAIHAQPADGSEALLVLHPDLMGVRPLFDEVCRRVATYGFAVCAPEPLARMAPDERAALDAAGRMAHVKELDDELQLDNLTTAADYLATTHGGDAVSITGFCMGGMYTLKAAASRRFRRAVPFYGMIRVPDDWRGPHNRDPLENAADVCPTLAIFGDSDPWVPMADIDALREAWRDRPDCEILVYPGADHGFVHDPDRPIHLPDAAADAWQRALAFLRG
jgi:carboxymethylenebutenolidase